MKWGNQMQVQELQSCKKDLEKVVGVAWVEEKVVGAWVEEKVSG